MLYSYDNYFSVSDILSALSWLILLSIVVFYKSSKLKTKRHARLYILNFYFKVFFGLAFALYYIVAVNGGDTLAYWDGAKSIQDLLYHDPFKGIEHLFTTPTHLNYYTFFNGDLKRPPIWIYHESESYLVCKITSVIGIFTLKSYLATTIIFAYIFSLSNWKLFEIIEHSNLFKQKFTAFASLFIPSVSFWCAGISKDTVVLSAIFVSFYAIYNLIKWKNGKVMTSILLLCFSFFLIFEARPVILMIVVISGIFFLFSKLSKQVFTTRLSKTAFNILLLLGLISSTIFFANSDFGQELVVKNELMQQAMIIQSDFTYNQFYGKNQYSLGEYELSPLGILSAIPISIFSGIFQPLPWNGLSVSLFLNAIESAILLFLLARIILTRQLFKWLNIIQKNELLVFCLVFVLILAYIAGFTSIIYGVLVRIRAPLLPIVTLLFIVDLAKTRRTIK